MFSFKLFAWLFYIEITLIIIQVGDTFLFDFLPLSWSAAIILIGLYILVFLPIILIINRLLYILEHTTIRFFLRLLNSEEKGVLVEFIKQNRTLDVPLNYQSKSVQQLANSGIVRLGTGLSYPKSDLFPALHGYYSMPTWIFEYLKRNLDLLEIKVDSGMS